MEKFKKHLCIRLTDDQFRQLADRLVDEELNKSILVRNLIQDYLETHQNKSEGQNIESNERD